MKLIGYAFLSGRIDFTREDNPWAFARIDSGMKQSQRDRIRVDPSQAPVELRSAPVNGEEVPSWMERMETVLSTADSMYLQYKSGVLRFRRANHAAGASQNFITLGNQDEVDLYAAECWKQVHYLYAERRLGAFCFDVTRMITHKAGLDKSNRRIELIARQDLHHVSGEPQFAFDSTGAHASVDIIEWRGSVKEGETGRYAPDNSHLEISLSHMVQPFTFLHEDREEFHNHSYTFSGDKMRNQLDRLIKKRLAKLDEDQAETDDE